MKLSKRTEYAIRAMVHLGKLEPGQFMQARDIASAENLPAKFLESVMLTLKKVGVAQSKVGSGGGYRLSKRPSDLLIGRIIRQLEGESPSPARPEGPIGQHALGMIQELVAGAHAKTLDTLSLEQLLDDVLKTMGQSRQDMYFI